MFELRQASVAVAFANRPQAATGSEPQWPAGACRGNERRFAAAHATRPFAAMFDEIDHGVLLV